MVRRDPTLIDRVAVHLAASDPRVRGGAASALAELAEGDPLRLEPWLAALVTALDCEELPTRLGAYRALAAIASQRPEALDDEFDTIRLGLFDPASPEIRR